MTNSKFSLNGKTYRNAELLGNAMRASIRRKVAKREENVAIETALEMRSKTPVRTGAAKSHWYVTRGSIPDFNSNKVGSQDLNIDLSGSGLIKIGNPTPYINDLEFGSSDQAPTGFIRLTLQNLSQIMLLAAARDK